MQHQRDGEIVGVVARLAQRLVIERDLVLHLVNRLTQQVGQHICPDLARLFPSGGVSGGGDPDRQFFRHRARLGHDAMQRAIGLGVFDCFPGPEAAQLFDLAQHGGFVFGRRVFGAQHKIIGLPAAGNGQPRAPVGEIVDHRPFLGNPRGVVQGRDAGPCAHADIAGHARDSSASDRGVRVRPAKGVEMPLGSPDSAEAVRVGEFRPFDQGQVFVAAHTVVISPVIETEIHLTARGRGGSFQLVLFIDQHQLVAAREAVEELQHRDIKTERGDSQPCAGRVAADAVIHPSEEIHHVAVFHHNALGPPGGAGGVDEIGEVFRCRLRRRIGSVCRLDHRFAVDDQRAGLGLRQRVG